MNKAFIFDMDGVIVDSERAWEKYAKGFFSELVGIEIAEKVGDLIGMTVNEAYEKSVQHGLSMDKNAFQKKFDEKAAFVYSKAKISERIDGLTDKLAQLGFKLGLFHHLEKTGLTMFYQDFRSETNLNTSYR